MAQGLVPAVGYKNQGTRLVQQVDGASIAPRWNANTDTLAQFGKFAESVTKALDQYQLREEHVQMKNAYNQMIVNVDAAVQDYKVNASGASPEERRRLNVNISKIQNEFLKEISGFDPRLKSSYGEKFQDYSTDLIQNINAAEAKKIKDYNDKTNLDSITIAGQNWSAAFGTKDEKKYYNELMKSVDVYATDMGIPKDSPQYIALMNKNRDDIIADGFFTQLNKNQLGSAGSLLRTYKPELTYDKYWELWSKLQDRIEAEERKALARLPKGRTPKVEYIDLVNEIYTQLKAENDKLPVKINKPADSKQWSSLLNLKDGENAVSKLIAMREETDPPKSVYYRRSNDSLLSEAHYRATQYLEEEKLFQGQQGEQTIHISNVLQQAINSGALQQGSTSDFKSAIYTATGGNSAQTMQLYDMYESLDDEHKRVIDDTVTGSSKFSNRTAYDKFSALPYAEVENFLATEPDPVMALVKKGLNFDDAKKIYKSWDGLRAKEEFETANRAEYEAVNIIGKTTGAYKSFDQSDATGYAALKEFERRILMLIRSEFGNAQQKNPDLSYVDFLRTVIPQKSFYLNEKAATIFEDVKDDERFD